MYGWEYIEWWLVPYRNYNLLCDVRQCVHAFIPRKPNMTCLLILSTLHEDSMKIVLSYDEHSMGVATYLKTPRDLPPFLGVVYLYPMCIAFAYDEQFQGRGYIPQKPNMVRLFVLGVVHEDPMEIVLAIDEHSMGVVTYLRNRTIGPPPHPQRRSWRSYGNRPCHWRTLHGRGYIPQKPNNWSASSSWASFMKILWKSSLPLTNTPWTWLHTSETEHGPPPHPQRRSWRSYGNRPCHWRTLHGRGYIPQKPNMVRLFVLGVVHEDPMEIVLANDEQLHRRGALHCCSPKRVENQANFLHVIRAIWILGQTIWTSDFFTRWTYFFDILQIKDWLIIKQYKIALKIR